MAENKFLNETGLRKLVERIKDYNESSISKLEESIVPADWNENDPTSVAYIQNRPFYAEDTVETLLVDNVSFETTDAYGAGIGIAENPFALELVENAEYTVTWNGTAYSTTCSFADGAMCVGNLSAVGIGDDTGEPFLIGVADGITFVYCIDIGTITVSIIGRVAEIHKIDKKYLDLPDGASIGVAGEVYGAEVFNDYTNNIASGSYSHSEGYLTKASGSYSHAEGFNTNASGVYSHAEGGNTVASGEYSHSEGNHTTASGNLSHAEGSYTTASGKWSHAEGYYTRASADYSHAEGYYTRASSEAQHVQGQFNIEDTAKTYLHIVGNGESNSKRSNAHTLDWSGNAWYKGNLKVGGTSYADASEVLTKSSIEPIENSVSTLESNVSTLESNISTIESVVAANKATLDKIEFSSSKIIWDGNTDGLEVFQGALYKVSDEVISITSLMGQSFTVYSGTDKFETSTEVIGSENIFDLTPQGMPMTAIRSQALDNVVACVVNSNFTHNDSPVTTGTYLICVKEDDIDVYVSELNYSGSGGIAISSGGTGANNVADALKNLGINATTSSITWNGDHTGLENVDATMFKVSDLTITQEEVIGKEFTVTCLQLFPSGSETFVVDSSMISTVEGLPLYMILLPDLGGLPAIMVCNESFVDVELVVNAGIYFYDLSQMLGAPLYTSEFKVGNDSVISIASGGTGANNSVDALNNLGISWGDTDMAAGTSTLETGKFYFVYE